jgi:hypothetical protein
MKSAAIATFFILISVFSFSQKSDSVTYKKPTISWGGFVRADAIFDTRQVVEAREGYILLYPKNSLIDANGTDINAQGSLNQYAMAARLVARVKGPDVLNAKVTAMIEADFTGASNLENNSFRLRHAYTRLSWTRVTLLAGQYWHPLDVPEMLPDVLALNTGAPFHSYSRQPQVRMDLKYRHINLVLVASSQRDYVNSGPEKDSSSYIYLKNSVIPNLHAQLQFSGDKVFLGAGFDYKQIVPRLKTSLKLEADEKLNCFSGTAFMKIKLNPFTWKTQVIYGQNLNDHTMLGGYGVSSIDSTTDHRTYLPLNYLSAWTGFTRIYRNLQFSLFLGYTKAYGASDSLIAPYVYSRGVDRWGGRKADIDYIYRISPMVTWNIGNLALNAELEITTAAYGPADEKYRIISSKEVTNLRTTVALIYTF